MKRLSFSIIKAPGLTIGGDLCPVVVTWIEALRGWIARFIRTQAIYCEFRAVRNICLLPPFYRRHRLLCHDHLYSRKHIWLTKRCGSLLPRHCSAPFNSWVARTSMAARTVQSWFKVRRIPTMDSPIATYSKSVLSAHKQR